MAPIRPFSKRHFSASCFSSLACKSQVVYFPFRHSPGLNQRPLIQNLVAPTFEHVGWCDIAQRLVVSLVIVMVNPFSDGLLKRLWVVIVFKLHHVLHRTMVALDLALSLRMIGSTSGMLHLLLFQILLELFR